MLVHHVASPEKLINRFPASILRINENVLIPWKMMALGIHFTGWLTVTDYRQQLLQNSVPAEFVVSEDRDLERHSMNVCLALTFFAIFVSAFAFLSARTISIGPINLLSSVGHTVSGILLLLIWNNDAHVVRLWHTFFVFTMVPGLFELIAIVMIRLRGTYMW